MWAGAYYVATVIVAFGQEAVSGLHKETWTQTFPSEAGGEVTLKHFNWCKQTGFQSSEIYSFMGFFNVIQWL